MSFAWFYRRRLRRELLLLVMAVGFWITSVASDFLQEIGVGQSYIVEDGSKAVGVVLWTVMLVRLTLAALEDRIRDPSEPSADTARHRARG